MDLSFDKSYEDGNAVNCSASLPPVPSDGSIALAGRLIDRMKEGRLARKMPKTWWPDLSGVGLGVISPAESHERVPGMAALRDQALALESDCGKLRSSVEKDQ